LSFEGAAATPGAAKTSAARTIIEIFMSMSVRAAAHTRLTRGSRG
jgi:hypothetical protein